MKPPNPLRRPEEFPGPADYFAWQEEWLREEEARRCPPWKRRMAGAHFVLTAIPLYILRCVTILPFVAGFEGASRLLGPSAARPGQRAALAVLAGFAVMAAILLAISKSFAVSPALTVVLLLFFCLWARFIWGLRL